MRDAVSQAVPRDLTPVALAAGLAVAAALWVGVLVAAPAAAARGTAAWLPAMAYPIGARICHQRPERSFSIAGVQMPVCARCTGLYVGGAIGLLLGWSLRRQWPAATTRAILVAGLTPIAVTVALEWAGLIETSNLVRSMTGLPAGWIAGLVVTGLLRGPA